MNKNVTPAIRKTHLKTHGLVRSIGLPKEYFDSIIDLAALCNSHDNIIIELNTSILLNRSNTEINDFLYFNHGKLIGYMGLFILDSETVEIRGMVHPEYRNHGIFSKLFTVVKVDISNRGFHRILFVCENNSTHGASYMKFIEAQYFKSEANFDYYQLIL